MFNFHCVTRITQFTTLIVINCTTLCCLVTVLYNYHLLPKFLLLLLLHRSSVPHWTTASHSSSPLPLVTSGALFVFMILPFLDFSCKCSHTLLSFCVGLMSHSVMCSRFLLAVACIRTSFLLFLGLRNGPLFGETVFCLSFHLLLVPWVVSPIGLLWVVLLWTSIYLLSSFQSAGWGGVCVCVCVCSMYLGVESLGHRGILAFTLGGMSPSYVYKRGT